LIVDYLKQNKAATYSEIENILKVSNMTVRRDIVSLAAAGKVIKTLGGAQIFDAPADMFESQVLSRLSVHSREKKAIALQAVSLIDTQDIIYLDGSSTCLELAKTIVETETPVTVVTNSLLVYMELVHSRKVTVICIGGQHDPVSYCLTGPEAETQAEKYFINKAFVSTKGFSTNEGTYESLVATYRIKQIIVSKSSQVVLLVDHSKFGQKSLCKVLDIDQINTVITDSQVSQTDIGILQRKIENVMVCDVSKEFMNTR